MKKFRKDDVEVIHTKGSGPGGQNRNKRMSGIRITHKETGLVVRATERRSQEQNLKAAYERMEEKLERFHHKPKTRHETNVSKSQKRKRLDEKRHHARKKQSRGSRSDWD